MEVAKCLKCSFLEKIYQTDVGWRLFCTLTKQEIKVFECPLKGEEKNGSS